MVSTALSLYCADTPRLSALARCILSAALPVWRGFERGFRGKSAGPERRLPLNDRDSLNYRGFVKQLKMYAPADCAGLVLPVELPRGDGNGLSDSFTIQQRAASTFVPAALLCLPLSYIGHTCISGGKSTRLSAMPTTQNDPHNIRRYYIKYALSMQYPNVLMRRPK